MIWNLSSIIRDPLGTLKTYACLIPVILLSLTLHEWGHAFAAHKCGDDTALNLGRLTLNPFAHLDIIGFFSMLLLGFGWAKPVPVNSRNFRNYKVGEAVVSLAGVLMNLLLAIAFSLLTLQSSLLLPMPKTSSKKRMLQSSSKSMRRSRALKTRLSSTSSGSRFPKIRSKTVSI